MNLEELACKIACQDLLVRFCLALDAGRNADAAALFSDDVTLVFPTGEVTGAAARTFIENRWPEIVTRHIMTNMLIETTGPDIAKGYAYILVYRVPREPSSVPRPLPSAPNAAGDWDIQFKKTPAGWRISRYEASSVLARVE
jgi:hypothetical protein